MKREKVLWLVAAVVMLLGCAAVLAACAPKKSASKAEPGAPSVKSWAIMKFVVEDEKSVADAYALVNPWELEEGEAWKCGVDAGDYGYQFFAIIQRNKLSSSGFLVGLLEVRGETITAIFAGSFPMGESDAAALTLSGAQSRTVMLDMVSGERLEEFRKGGADFVKCEKKKDALVPERVK